MEYTYAVTCTYDSAPTPKWSGRFDNALEAVNCYNKFIDHGFANEYSTINLSEPNGKMFTKILYRNGNIGGK